jgi:hypothetical protein
MRLWLYRTLKKVSSWRFIARLPKARARGPCQRRHLEKDSVPYDSVSGLRRPVSVDWEPSEGPSLGEANVSYLAPKYLVSVGEAGGDVVRGLCTGSLAGPDRPS